MKTFVRILLLVFALQVLSLSSFSQPWRSNLSSKKDGNYTFYDYQNAFNEYWNSFEVGPNGKYLDNDGNLQKAYGYKQFKRWEWYWQPRVNWRTGEFPKESVNEIWNKYKSSAPKSVGGTWVSIGDEVYDPITSGSLQECGTGRINCAYFDPNDDDHIWVGAPAGGLWESKDAGATWTCKTDNNPILGVTDIALSPDYATDKTIYIATGDRDAGDDPSIGILKSTDDGATWNTTGLKFKSSNGAQVVRVIVDPDNADVIYAATSVGFYKSTDAGENFTLTLSDNLMDMEMIPGSESGTGGADLLATTNTSETKVYRSTDAGETWSNPFTGAATESRSDIAVTPADTDGDPATYDFVYITTTHESGGLGGVYRSSNGGASFSLVYDGSSTSHNLFSSTVFANQSSGGQGWYDVALAVSNTDEDVVYVAGVNAYISTNGGSSFSVSNLWDPAAGSADYVHADHHNAYYRASDNRLFDCNDGGFYYSDNSTSGSSSNWTDIADGLVTGQVYDLSVSQTVSGNVVQGYQDNGTKYRDVSYSTTDWEQVREGDGMASAIDPTNINNQWTSYPTGYVFRTTNEWGSYTYLRTSTDAAWYFPVEADPILGSTVYVGAQAVERYVGTTKTTLGTLSAYLLTMDVYNDGSNLVIWTGSSSDLWKSNTSGGSYTSVYSGLPGNQVTDIAIDDDDYNHVYVSLGGYDYYTVYETTDGGSNWTDISTGLPPVPAGAIVINEQNTTEHEIYVGTDAGIFVKVGDDGWRLFNDGMPVVSITDLEIYYDATPANSKLYAATYGRDTWVSDLYSEPTTPMAYSSSTTTQLNNYDVISGTVKNEIICIEVETSGATSPLDVTSFTFSTNGSTNASSDISNAKVYYSGASNAFATSDQFGSVYSNPNGSFTITGTQTLTCGTNYFWLTYDLDASATVDNYVDAECSSITVGGSAKTPTITAPSGNRKIIDGSYCDSYSSDLVDGYGISRVVFNTIDNGDGSTTSGHYNDYTATSTTVDAGSSYDLSVTLKTGSNTFYASAWIDWNQDYDFDDPGETFNLGSNASDGLASNCPYSVEVPVDALGGSTRMRVVATFDAPAVNCGEYRYGETEDYTINVNSLTPPSISSVSPSSGTLYKDGGKDITITGSDLSGATSVTVAGVEAIILSNSSTQIDIELTGGDYSGTNEIVVTNGVGSDNAALTFTYDTRNTIPVGSAADQHSTIQYALDGLLAWKGTSAFTSPMTIDVYSGTYAEKVTPDITLNTTVDNPLIIQNHSGETPVINASGETNGIYIGALDYVEIKGFTVHSATADNVYSEGDNNSISFVQSYGSTGGSGIGVNGASAIVTNNLCYGNYDYGIHVNASDATVYNNTLDDNGHSIAEQLGLSIESESFNPDATGWTLGSWATSTTGRTDSYSIARTGSSATVISPVYNISGYINVDINYWDRSASNGGTMNAEYSLDGGVWTSFSTESPVRNSWTQHPSGTLSLSGSSLQLRFTGYSGNVAKSIYLDDIVITGDIPASAIGAGLYFESGTGADIQNNIVVSKSGNDDYYTLESETGITVSSDYNTYYTANTSLFNYNGTIGNTGPIGSNDQVADPLFVGGGDYHVQSILGTYTSAKAPIWPPDAATGGTWTTYGSDSPTLDAGNPAHDYSNELDGGGGAIDQGSFGNTPQATKGDGTLPVVWKSYEAKCIDGAIEINWSTFSEINNDYFTIEKIINDKFEAVANISGSGNSVVVNSYSFIDNDVSNENYYRIKQTDYDDKVSYSSIFNAKCDEISSLNEDPIFNIYPNPFIDQVVIDILNCTAKEVTIDIVNQIGIVLGHRKINADNSKGSKIKLNTSNLPQGVYFVKITAGNVKHSHKIIKN